MNLLQSVRSLTKSLVRSKMPFYPVQQHQIDLFIVHRITVCGPLAVLNGCGIVVTALGDP